MKSKDEIQSLGVSYDLHSIMQYSSNTFAKSPALTAMVPKVPFVGILGQRKELSSKDQKQANLLYKCSCKILWHV